METVAERMADHLVGHHPRVPRFGQAQQALAAPGSLIDAVHDQKSARRKTTRLTYRFRWVVDLLARAVSTGDNAARGRRSSSHRRANPSRADYGGPGRAGCIR